jgi:hypothetical protein
VSGEDVRRDAGGWISGPSISTKAVKAVRIRPGDVVLMNDGTISEVTLVQAVTVRLPGNQYGPGRALWWAERGGTASGVMVRADGDLLDRVPAS